MVRPGQNLLQARGIGVLRFERVLIVLQISVAGHSRVGIRDHLAAFGEADRDIVDVPTFVIVILAAVFGAVVVIVGALELAKRVAIDVLIGIGVCRSGNRVDQQVGRIERGSGRAEVESKLLVVLPGVIAKIAARLAPAGVRRRTVEERLDALQGVARAGGAGDALVVSQFGLSILEVRLIIVVSGQQLPRGASVL